MERSDQGTKPSLLHLAHRVLGNVNSAINHADQIRDALYGVVAPVKEPSSEQPSSLEEVLLRIDADAVQLYDSLVRINNGISGGQYAEKR
ncbi:hypothetical protein D3C78_1329470 [compost metagenome]